MALRSFEKSKSSLLFHEFVLSHKFYSTDASSRLQRREQTKATSDENRNPELQDINNEEEEDNFPDLDKTDEIREKKKWKRVDAAREICQVLGKGDEDMEEALDQLGVLLNPRLVNIVFDKTSSPNLARRFSQWAKA